MIKKTKNGYQICNSKGVPLSQDNLTLIDAKRLLRLLEDFMREIMKEEL